MKHIKRIVAIVIFIVLIATVSGCDVIRAIINLYNPPAYSQRQYVEPDKEKTDAILDEIKSLCEKVGSTTAINAKRTEFFTEYNQALTSRTVAQIEYFRDVTITENKERAEHIESYFNQLHNQALEVEKAILNSSYSSIIIDSLGQSYADGILNQPIKTEELLALEARETQLENEYSSAYSDNSIPKTSERFTEKMASIYKELIITRNKIARLNNKEDGTPYSNYPEYAYNKIYGRDYTPETAAGFRRAIKENFYGIGKKLLESSSNLITAEAQTATINDYQIKEYMPKIISATAPTALPRWEYMISLGLYDFRKSENKYPGSFVTEFQQYGDGFMFINANGRLMSDLSTIIHEFGHYNAIFAQEESKKGDGTIYSIDLAETHSQTFELLSLPAVKTLLNENELGYVYESYITDILLQSVWSMLSNSLFDEFEYIVYTADENALNEQYFTETFNTVWSNYWTNRNYEYYDIPHLYSAPSYCISYSVSMMFAQEIWMSENALENYLNVVSYGTDHYISYVAGEVGLADPLHYESVESVAEKFKNKTIELLGLTFDNGAIAA